MARSEDKNKAMSLAANVSGVPSATAVLPIAVGAGIIAHSIYSVRNKLLKDIFPSAQQGAASNVQNLIRDMKGRGTSATFVNLKEKIKGLTRGKWTAGIDSDSQIQAIMTAFQNALFAATNERSRSSLLDKVNQFRGQLSGVSATERPTQLVNYIAEELGSVGNSIPMQRVGMRFAETIGAMQKGLTSNQSLMKLPTLPSEPAAINMMRGMQIRGLGPGVNAQIAQLKKGLGAGAVTYKEITKQGFEGSILDINFTGKGLGKGVNLQIPRTIGSSGIVTSPGFRNQNIVGFAAVIENNRIVGVQSYEEWALLQARSHLLPRIKGMQNPEDIQAAISEFHTTIDPRRLTEFEGAIGRRREYFPHTFTPGTAAPGYERIISEARNTAFLVDKKGQRLGGPEVEDLIRGGHLSSDVLNPLTGVPINLEAISPNKTRKAVLRATRLESPVAIPGLFPGSRRPHQRVKPYIPSDSATQVLSSRWQQQGYGYLEGSGMQGRGVAGVHFFSKNGIEMEEGAMYVSSRLEKALETQTTKHLHFHLDPTAGEASLLATIGDRFEAIKGTEGRLRLKTGSNPFIEAGTFLGFGPDRSPVLASNRMKILDAAMFKNRLTVSAVQEVPFSSSGKMYGTEKAMAMLADDKFIRAKTGKLAADFLSHIDSLKKNRALLMEQVFSGLTLVDRWNGLGTARSFNHEQFFTTHIAGLHSGQEGEALSKIVAQAKAMGITPEDAGLVFGALPHAAADINLASIGITDPAWLKAIQSTRGVIGIGHLYSGGPKELTGGAGTQLGSVEPRAFQILKSGTLGSMSQDIYEDIASRSILSNPAAVLSGSELHKSLVSMGKGNSITPPPGAQVTNLSDINSLHFDTENPRFLLSGESGKYINLQGMGGLGNIYVPSGDMIREAALYRTEKGQVIQADLAADYLRFVRLAQQAQREKNTAIFNQAYTDFVNILAKAHAGTRTGKGGIASGKLVGSRFFTLLPSDRSDMYSIGLHEEHFRQMFTELYHLEASHAGTNVIDDEFQGALQGAMHAFKNGPGYGGYITRHPMIGQYSILPVRFRHDPAAALGEMRVPLKETLLDVGGKQKAVKTSVLTGLAADFDADTVAGVLASPDMQSKVAAMTMGKTEFTEAYSKFANRAGLLKIRSAKEGLTSEAGEMMKLAVSDRIGQISYRMSVAKAALLHQGVNEHTNDSLYLLEWLEQNVISGKHLSSEEAFKLPDLIKDVTGAVEGGYLSSPEMIEQIKGAMKPEELAASGFSIEKAAGNIDQAVGKFGRWRDALSGGRAYEMLRGKGTIAPSDIFEYLGAHEKSFLKDFFAEDLPGFGLQKVGKAALDVVGHISEAVMNNKKMLGLGVGAALITSALLSVPRRSLAAPDGIAEATLNTNMGDNVRTDNITPDTHTMGQPTPPRLPSRGPAPISQQHNAMSARIRIQAQGGGQFDPNAMSGAVRNTLGVGTRVSTRLRDERTTLTSQKVSDILSR